jgi:dTDP-4-dehydrorhamnose reductase
MKILVTGGYGQLGTALKEVLALEETLFTDTDSMDITNKDQIGSVFADFKPEFLIHGAAYTNVDGCEENPELAEKVNAKGTKNLAEICKQANCTMVYISTDYVFDGNAKLPIREDETTNPMSVYGATKLKGEEYTREIADGYILRTSWVYGEGKNFVKTMLSLSEKLTELKVVGDQVGRPTYALDLAQAIYDVIKANPERGIYNVTGDGDIISWAEFARAIFKIAGKNTKVVTISTEEYLSQYPDKKIAPRPAYSALNLEKAIKNNLTICDWKDSLIRYLGVE